MPEVARTTRLVLVTIPVEELAAIRDGDRRGRAWAEDYPADDDRMLADLALSGGVPWVRADEPWGPLQVRLLDTDVAIGGAGFKGRPDDEGETEIGYGFVRSARGHGYATEAVGALVEVARARGLRALTAETAADNEASRRVLEKNGFLLSDRDGEALRWRLEL